MGLEIKYVAQLHDTKSGEIVEEKVLQSKAVTLPKSFNDFGLRHGLQIKLIKEAQDFFLRCQTKLFSDDQTCPKCGKRSARKGAFESDFHDVFTDHRVTINRLMCSCGWKNKFTINSIYGKATHPELAKIQAMTGSKNSFEEASKYLNAVCHTSRKINNDVTIMRTTNQVGEILEASKKTDEWAKREGKIVSELILCVDGGHVQTREAEKHSFEEMVSTAYNPDDVLVNKKGEKEIKKKICVASAKSDKQHSIKKLTSNACKKLGMTTKTKITALTDGAKNCWSIVKSLKNDCDKVTEILDWFHIGKKFKERESCIPEEHNVLYNKAKWHLWHGRPSTGIIRLNQLIEVLSDNSAIKKVKELIRYISQNEDKIINYHIRRIRKLPYSSQLAESSVNSVINDRQKNRKMRWTRAGAHNVLQIRTSVYSNRWDDDWKFVQENMYKDVV